MSILSSLGGVSVCPSTDALSAKWLFRMSDFSFESVTVLSFSISGGIVLDLNLRNSLLRILNFFFADIYEWNV